MIENAMPQDILKYKTKFIGGLSLRESICVGLGVIAALIGYFILFAEIEGNMRFYLAAFVALPFFGLCKTIFGQPPEKVLLQIIWDNLICPPIRKNEVHRTDLEKTTTSDKKKTKVVKSKEYKAIK